MKLYDKDITFIAEVKTKSPFGFKSEYSFDHLLDIANFYGDWISIHIDERWGGSFDLLKQARKGTHNIILAKGIHESDDLVQKSFDSGADYVLVVGRIPDKKYLENCLIEPLSLEQLLGWNLKDIPKLVWNKRNLKDGRLSKEDIPHIRSLYNGWLCQASGIKNINDINEKIDAFIVGENLVEFVGTLKT